MKNKILFPTARRCSGATTSIPNPYRGSSSRVLNSWLLMCHSHTETGRAPPKKNKGAHTMRWLDLCNFIVGFYDILHSSIAIAGMEQARSHGLCYNAVSIAT